MKGSVFVHARAHVVARHGEPAWERVVASLPETDRPSFDTLFLAGSWYPIRLWNALLEAYLPAFHADTDAGMLELSRFVADRDLNTLFKLILRASSPRLLMSRGGSLWSRYFDIGSLGVRELAPGSWELVLDAPVRRDEGPSVHVCRAGVPGWVVGGLELTGARNPRCTHEKCRFAGSSTCTYSVRWG